MSEENQTYQETQSTQTLEYSNGEPKHLFKTDFRGNSTTRSRPAAIEPSRIPILIWNNLIDSMVGRLASFALESAISRRRIQAGMSQHYQAQQAQQTQQQEIEKLKAAQAAQPQQQEDITQQLQKFAVLPLAL